MKKINNWWEDICTKCGACCYRRDRVDGNLLIKKNLPCRFLDTSNDLCTVYETRLKTCSECSKVTIFHALFSRYLPDDCGYVVNFRKWKLFSKLNFLAKKKNS